MCYYSIDLGRSNDPINQRTLQKGETRLPCGQPSCWGERALTLRLRSQKSLEVPGVVVVLGGTSCRHTKDAYSYALGDNGVPTATHARSAADQNSLFFKSIPSHDKGIAAGKLRAKRGGCPFPCPV